MSWLRILVLIGLVAIFTSHLAAQDKEVASIKGTVHLDGVPLPKGKVAFHPTAGKPVVADIKDGEYSVKAVPTGVLGVTIEAVAVPKVYADPKTTPLKVEIKQGENNCDVKLRGT
jgi:hypothetical protein